jgi:hypothetical protein
MSTVPEQPLHATPATPNQAPVSEIDPYSDEALIDPWNVCRELRDLGPAVWLTRYRMFALTRYENVIRALKTRARSRRRPA